MPVTTQGFYLRDFGSGRGALLTCQFDPDAVHDATERTDYFQSVLGPSHSEPYRRSVFVALINDWGWFGDESAAPDWFSGGLGKHGVIGAGTSGNT